MCLSLLHRYISQKRTSNVISSNIILKAISKEIILSDKVRKKNSPHQTLLRVLRETIIVKGGKVSHPLPYRALPKELLNIVKSIPGNGQCCDCGDYERDGRVVTWASVSSGILLCKDCAFRHITKSDEVSQL